jgi:hypothetical protein
MYRFVAASPTSTVQYSGRSRAGTADGAAASDGAAVLAEADVCGRRAPSALRDARGGARAGSSSAASEAASDGVLLDAGGLLPGPGLGPPAGWSVAIVRLIPAMAFPSHWQPTPQTALGRHRQMDIAE